MKTRINILVSSTWQWNPGDEIIRIGTQRVVESILGNRYDINWLPYNRNPDCFVDYPKNAFPSSNSHSNHFNYPPIKPDLVVMVGSPEWLGIPLAPLYQMLYKTKIPLLALGVGYSMPGISLLLKEKQVLSRPETLIITRAQEVANEVNNELGIEKSTTGPCPALFIPHPNIPVTKQALVVAQAQGTLNQSISKKAYRKAINLVNQGHDLLCYYPREFTHFTKLGYKPIYVNTGEDAIKTIAKYRKVYSTRLHAGIAAQAMGKEVEYLYNPGQDYRIETALKNLSIKGLVGDSFTSYKKQVRKFLQEKFDANL